ncbi:MAG: hypothetical protein IKR85_05575 [Clostridia bacterium]|nr:hypothetical protein [Clostridia bacterium]
MKKVVRVMVIAALVLALCGIGTVQAAIIPPSGVGQIGISAIVGCEQLNMYEARDTSSKVVLELDFGSHIIVLNQADGWAECVDSDSLDALHGWVAADELILDPAFYLTEATTNVYAWNDTSAPKAAVLDEYTLVPVLKIDGEWLVISWRGATGWINTGSARQNGERFEGVIMLEGMEETVNYEHIVNNALGFEMDYDYELLTRRSDAERECFVSVYDDADKPENYLVVTCSSLKAPEAAAAAGEALSKEYSIHVETDTLARAGDCIYIDASADVSGEYMPEHLQGVYIIPADDGCRIVTAHYAIEASEGFAARFRAMMDTFTVTDSRK